MADIPLTTKQVKALHDFQGKHNDELCFIRGELITLTQVIDGGWWEGTLNGKTGWFPSNFVKEIKTESRAGACSPTESKSTDSPITKRESIMTYHDVVLRSLKDTERAFVTDLQYLLQNYLRPLQISSQISKTEYSNICANLEEIASEHNALLSSLDECAKQAVSQQRVGGIFIKMAPQLQNLYHTYCSNHPRAVSVLQTKRDELSCFMESKGASSPGIEVLTTSLSKPFTRLDKYASMLKELERHTEESHVDRGDTQRAISVYRDIASSCAEIRKQKEVEYDIMNSSIQGWEGDEICTLGDVLLLSHVRVHADNGEKKERLFLLFPGVLVMLSVTARMSQYIYEGRLPVSGMNVSSLEESDGYNYAFEITGSLIDRRIVSCGSNTEKKNWMDTLRQQAKLGPAIAPSKPQNLQVSTSQPSISNVGPCKTAQTAQVLQHNSPQRMKGASSPPPPPPAAASPPPPIPAPPVLVASSLSKPALAVPMPWSLMCLRPAPPLRPVLVGRGDEAARSPRSARRLLGTSKRKPDDPKTLEEDALILKVIEAYCTSAKARHTVNSSILESPQVLIVEEEKIIVEENKGGQVIVEEKTLVDTVYFLKDQIKDIKQEQQNMRQNFEEERKSRKKLESMIRKSLKSCADVNSEENTQISSL